MIGYTLLNFPVHFIYVGLIKDHIRHNVNPLPPPWEVEIFEKSEKGGLSFVCKNGGNLPSVVFYRREVGTAFC